MSAVLVIFPGLSFNYGVLDHALAFARQQHTDVQVLFLVEPPVEEDYLFPSDIDAAESLTDIADAVDDDRRLLHSKAKLIRDKAQTAGVACTVRVSNDASVDSILEVAGNVSKIFVDGGAGREEGAAGSLVDPKALSEKAACPVEVIETT
ncbi:hypothetical protein [Paraflavitalea pollutisoli]|uniref:hypothetical protein n=1 Tax=Paraflavitalea pollutisoli TaxID=3034143 RepID=UPI0023EC1F32|nr:hypothetical protein [Paraflavitalea sp. H1-2-19X]